MGAKSENSLSSSIAYLKEALKISEKTIDVALISTTAGEMMTVLSSDSSKKKADAVKKLAFKIRDGGDAFQREKEAKEKFIKKYIKELQGLEKKLAKME